MLAGGLVLHASPIGPGTVARAEWRGASDLTPLLRGTRPAEAVRTVALLHALCPFAHGVAMLRAMEAAAGMTPDPNTNAARETLCLGDMLAAQVWRGAVSWPKLSGGKPNLAGAADARAAAHDLRLALYPQGDWDAPGSGEVMPDWPKLAAAVARFEKLLSALPVACPPVEPSRLGRYVAKRFAGMMAAPARTVVALKAALTSVRPCPARPLASVAFGNGRGVARTARGPLIYGTQMAEWRIETAHVSAPSARRFEPAGRFARIAARYARPDEIPLLAAAFDPCADVTIAEAGHA